MTGVLSSVLQPLKDEIGRQKKESEARRANKEPFSLGAFLSKWLRRFFYTLCLVMLAYVLIIGGTVMIPVTMGYLIGSLGYTVANSAEMLLAGLAGIFFTGWFFLLSFLAIRFAWRRYIIGMKNTLSGKAAERVEELK